MFVYVNTIFDGNEVDEAHTKTHSLIVYDVVDEGGALKDVRLPSINVMASRR
jgi:hypothetical protein